MPLKGSLKDNNYLSLFLILVGLFLMFEVFFSSLGIVFIKPLFKGLSNEELQKLLFEPSDKELRNSEVIFALKVLQIFSAIGRFMVSALVFSWLTFGNPVSDLKLKRKVSFKPVIYMLLLLTSAIPFVAWLGEWNQSVSFPEVFREWEQSFRTLEDRALRITEAFLSSPQLLDFLINILIVGVVAAVGEELLFRGALQNILTAWTRNKHLGIWLSAIFFSAVHLQFYGFFPRMLMGAMFGYLVMFGGSLWYPIIAHMVFNSIQIGLQYLFLIKDINVTADFSFSLWVLLSFIPISGFFYLFQNESNRAGSQMTNKQV